MSRDEEERYLTISQFSDRLKYKFDIDPELRGVFLRGELSNFRVYSSGHAYFSLKDEKAVISGIMWRDTVERLSFPPKDGDEVLVRGSVSVYQPQGKYQIYVSHMELFGQGNELLKLKELAKKLQAEGLFDESRKRPLPPFPKKIGVITAKGSAAAKDIVYNLQSRWPLADIVIFPSLVQGKEAPKDLIRAFNLSQKEDIDVLIVGRGGGSSEDLSAFNDEALVRALATSKCPLISAVGHEIDVSLTDLVADKRVSTPTGAAVAAVPDKNDILASLDDSEERLTNRLTNKIERYKEALESFSSRPFFLNPQAIYHDKLEDLSALKDRLMRASASSLKEKEHALETLKERLSALSPYGVLNRGYSFATDEEGKILSSVNDAKLGSRIKTHLKDGIIISHIEKKEGNAHE